MLESGKKEDVRHAQCLCLGIAGGGLLTIWPRFLLLGIWVSMLFLYATCV